MVKGLRPTSFLQLHTVRMYIVQYYTNKHILLFLPFCIGYKKMAWLQKCFLMRDIKMTPIKLKFIKVLVKDINVNITCLCRFSDSICMPRGFLLVSVSSLLLLSVLLLLLLLLPSVWCHLWQYEHTFCWWHGLVDDLVRLPWILLRRNLRRFDVTCVDLMAIVGVVLHGHLWQ